MIKVDAAFRRLGALGGLLLILLLAAGGLDRNVLVQRPAALGPEADLDDRTLGAEVAGVDQVALLAAEDRQAEVPDRGVGDDRGDGPQLAVDRGRLGARDEVDLAGEDERQARQPAGPGDRVDGARERLVEQRCSRRRLSDPGAALALGLGELFLRADVAEVPL